MKPFVCAIAFSALLLLVAAENTPVRGDCASDPQSAVADLKKLGARVTLDNEGKPTEVFFPAAWADPALSHLENLTTLNHLQLEFARKITADGWARLRRLGDLEYLGLDRDGIRDEDLRHLKGFARLKELRLGENRISGPGLAHLTGLAGLRTLHLYGNQFTDEGLVHLKALPRLRFLSLKNTRWAESDMRITSAGMLHLRGLTELRDLELTGTKVTAVGIRHLRGLTQLQTLNLGGDSVTDAAMAELRAFKKLKHIILESPAITDAGLAHLKSLTWLRALHLYADGITDAGILHLEPLEELELLDLGGARLTDTALANLTRLAKLKRLNLSGASRVRRHLRKQFVRFQYLKKLPSLEELDVFQLQIDGSGLVNLTELKSLKSLTLIDTSLTHEQVQKLRRALPDTEIIYFNFMVSESMRMTESRDDVEVTK